MGFRDRRAGIQGCEEVRERIYPLLLRTVSEADRERLLQHIGDCAACRLTVEAVRDRLQRIDGVFVPEVVARSTGRRRRRAWIAFLPLVPAVLAYVLLIQQGLKLARYRYERRFLIRLEKAILLYREDRGAYPPSDQAPLSVYLSMQSTDGTPYLDANRERMDAAGHFVDVWGHRYLYSAPGRHNPRLFDLQSLGQNGRDDHGERDDLANWG